jgi:tetratricopeptide (TPR) repeat protein
MTVFPHSGFPQESQEKLDFLYGERLSKEGLFDLAAIQFHRFVIDYPTSPRAPQAQWMAAESDLRSEKFEEARSGFLRYILNYPASPDQDLAQLKIGECFERQGLQIPAAQSYFRVYAIYPQSRWAGEGLVRNAAIYFNADSLSKAESSLRILLDLKNTPEITSKTTFLFADLFVKQEKYDAAIKLLTPFLSRPVRDPDQVRAEFQLGRIQETIGDWEKAKKHFQSATLAAGQDSTSQSAWLRLGLLNFMLGDRVEAAGNFVKCGALNIKPSLTDKAYYWLGKTESAGGRFQAALDAFNRIGMEAAGPIRSEARFEKARSLEALGRVDEAVGLYEVLSKEAAVSVRKKAMLALADAHCRKADFDSAFSLYDRYGSEFPDDPNADRVFLRKSDIAFDSLGRTEDGFESLRGLWKSCPRSALLPAAHFRYAEHLEAAGRSEEAASFYDRIRRQFPFTDWAERADRRLEFMDWNGAKEGPSLVLALSGLLKSVETNPGDPALYYTLGMVSFRVRGYAEAADCLKRWIGEGRESVQADTAIYCIAESYARMARLEARPGLADSAGRYYSILFQRFPSSPFAGRSLIKMNLHALESDPSAPFGNPASLPPDTGAEFESLLYRIARFAAQRDSFGCARLFLDRLHRDFPDGWRKTQVQFLEAFVEFRKGSWDSADSLLNLIGSRSQNSSAIADIDWFRGLAKWRKGDTAGAIFDFEKARKGCPSVVGQDSLLLTLGSACLENAAFKKAAEVFESALKADSAGVEALRLGLAPDFLSLRKPLLRGLSKAYSSINEYHKAKKALILYGEEGGSDPSDRFFVWTSLSKLADAEGKPDQARFFLQKILETHPSDSAYALLGLMQYRQGRNDEAIETLMKAFETASSPASRALLQSKIICAMFRLDRVQEGESRIKPFEGQFKNLPNSKDLLCEIEMEKGRALVRKKSFEQALKSFKNVQDQKRSPLAPEAELETGRVLLLMNKTEKGMELLTELPGKYPNHPILPRVYLNLGDQYYRLNQIENALAAFKNAAADSSDFDVSSVAVRYLIKIYEGIQMTDAAMALTRTYLRRYPDAEDALQKKIQIGIYYYELKEFDRALDRFRSLKPEADSESDAEIQYWLGKCYADMGLYEQAILEYLKVKYISPPTQLPWASTALYEAGIAYLRLHRPSTAKSMFEKIVTIEGASSDLGRIARQRIADIDQGKAGAAL